MSLGRMDLDWIWVPRFAGMTKIMGWVLGSDFGLWTVDFYEG